MGNISISEIGDGIVDAIATAALGFTTLRLFESRDLDDASGEVIVLPPAALVLYESSNFSPQNVNGTLYDDVQTWTVFCRFEHLGGHAGARAAGLAALEGLKKALASIDVTNTNAAKARLTLLAIEPAGAEAGKVDYVLTIEARTHFSIGA